MYIVLTGGAGRMTKPLALKLLEAGHAVIIITRNADHVADLTDPEVGGIAAAGSINDVDFLTKTFANADAVYTMVPPDLDKESLDGWKKQGETYATAIRNSGVKRVVQLSSVGAHLPEGAGPVSGLYYIEQALNGLEGVAVTHVRAAFLYYNFLENIPMVKHMNTIGANYGGEGFVLPLVDAADVATVVAAALTDEEATGHKVVYAVSDEATTDEAAATLGSPIGKPDLRWMVFTDEQSVQGMVQGGVPQKMAESLTEMGSSMRSGKMLEEYMHEKPLITGTVKLEDYAKDTFAQAYQATN